ncbi:MAG: hypothetical protein PVH68_16280 [Armatimonadota bacterium]
MLLEAERRVVAGAVAPLVGAVVVLRCRVGPVDREASRPLRPRAEAVAQVASVALAQWRPVA